MPSTSTALDVSDTQVKITYGGKDVYQSITVNSAKIVDVSGVSFVTPSSNPITIGKDYVLNSQYELTINVNYTQGEGYKDGNNSLLWSISSGGDYGELIDVGGKEYLKLKNNGSVTVCAKSQENPSVYAETLINIEQLKGTSSNPIGVLDFINSFDTINGSWVHIKGSVNRVDSSNNIFLRDLSEIDLVTPTNELEIYDNAKIFKEGSINDMFKGTYVEAYGFSKKYSSTYEISYSGSNHVQITKVTVEPVSEFTITTNPKNKYNVGDFFDPTGLTISYKRTHSDSFNDSYASSSSKFSFIPSLSTSLTASDDKVQIIYEGVTVNFPITIDTSVHTQSIEITLNGESIPSKKITTALEQDEIQFGYNLTPSDSSDPVSWSVDNDDIAMIDDGLLCVFGTGKVNVTATSNAKSDTVEVTVNQPSDATITSIAIVEGQGVVKDYYLGETEVNTTGLSVTATFTSQLVSSWSIDVENYTNNIAWSLDRQNSKVIAIYNNSQEIRDYMDVTIHNSERPSEKLITFDLSTLSTDSPYIAEEKQIGYKKDGYVVVDNFQNSSLACNNYYPGTTGKSYTSTRFYKSNYFVITSADGWLIESVTFFATSKSYAYAFAGGNWTDCSTKTEIDEDNEIYNAIIEPTDGTNIYGTLSATAGAKSISIKLSSTDDMTSALNFETNYILKPNGTEISYPSSIPTGISGSACLDTSKGGQNYCANAITSYDKLSTESKKLFSNSVLFENARNRLIAWGKANGISITFDTTTGEIKTASYHFSIITTNQKIVPVIISGIAILGATSFGVLLILKRKKKEN